MPRLVRYLVVLVPTVLVLATLGLWANRMFGPKPADPGPPPPEVTTATVAGVTFEIEHHPGGYTPSTTDDSLTVLRGAELLEFTGGYVAVNDIGFPDVKAGDLVRWNLSGPLLVNGVPQEPHPLQARPIDAAGTDLHWTPRPSSYPRDTLSVAWAGASRQLVAAHGDGAVRVWDADRGEVLRTFEPTPPKDGGRGWGYRAAVSPDGKTVAACNLNGDEVTLWDVASGNKTATFTEPKGKVTAVGFARLGWFEARGDRLYARTIPDGVNDHGVSELGTIHTQFAPPFTATTDGSILARNDGTKVSVGDVIWMARGVRVDPRVTIENVSRSGCLALSADGKLLAVFNGENRLTLHDTATGKQLHRLRWRAEDRTKPIQINALAFSPDGRTLAVGDISSVRLYDVSTGRERGGLASGWVRALAYSADGKTLAAGLRHLPGLRLWPTADLVAK